MDIQSLISGLIILGFNFVCSLLFVGYYRKELNAKKKLKAIFYITVGLELFIFGYFITTFFEWIRKRRGG